MKSPFSLNEESRKSLKVELAYEDDATGKRALHLLQSIADSLEGFEFHLDSWSFEAIHQRGNMETSASHALSADLLTVGFHGNKPLSQSLKAWLESYGILPAKPLALVVLFDEVHQQVVDTSGTRRSLEEFAARHQVELFISPPAIPTHNRVTQFNTKPEFDLIQERNPRWGLNEWG